MIKKEDMVKNMDKNAKLIGESAYNDYLIKSEYAGWHSFPTVEDYDAQQRAERRKFFESVIKSPKTFRTEYYKLKKETEETVILVIVNKETLYEKAFFQLSNKGEFEEKDFRFNEDISSYINTITNYGYSTGISVVKCNLIEKLNYDRTILPVIIKTLEESLEYFKERTTTKSDKKEVKRVKKVKNAKKVTVENKKSLGGR